MWPTFKKGLFRFGALYTGCIKLYSLLHLNVAGNWIHDLNSVLPISDLPNLESLNLQGNTVTTVVDYRLKVLESFGKRCSDLCLDNEFPSQPEIDKVSVLMALRVAREGRSATSLFGNLPRRVWEFDNDNQPLRIIPTRKMNKYLWKNTVCSTMLQKISKCEVKA